MGKYLKSWAANDVAEISGTYSDGQCRGLYTYCNVWGWVESMSWIRVEPTYEDPSDSEAGDSTALGDVHHVHGYNVIITTCSRPLYLNYLFASITYLLGNFILYTWQCLVSWVMSSVTKNKYFKLQSYLTLHLY